MRAGGAGCAVHGYETMGQISVKILIAPTPLQPACLRGAETKGTGASSQRGWICWQSTPQERKLGEGAGKRLSEFGWGRWGWEWEERGRKGNRQRKERRASAPWLLHRHVSSWWLCRLPSSNQPGRPCLASKWCLCNFPHRLSSAPARLFSHFRTPNRSV